MYADRQKWKLMKVTHEDVQFYWKIWYKNKKDKITEKLVNIVTPQTMLNDFHW